jgi:hypothetical protein
LWIVEPCRLVWVYRRFTGLYCLHHQGDEEAVQTSETSVNSHQSTRLYNPQDSCLKFYIIINMTKYRDRAIYHFHGEISGFITGRETCTKWVFPCVFLVTPRKVYYRTDRSATNPSFLLLPSFLTFSLLYRSQSFYHSATCLSKRVFRYSSYKSIS